MQPRAQASISPTEQQPPQNGLLGLGNVLLDVVLQISDEEFDDLHLGLPRGQVRRVSAAEQRSLLARFPKDRINRCPGGSCANVLRSYAWHGLPARLLGLAGDDEAADFLGNALRDAGVDTSGILRCGGHATDTCLVFVTPEGERTMLPCFDAGSCIRPDSFSEADLNGFYALHLEGYNLRFPEALAGILAMARRRRLRLSWDLGDASLVHDFYDKLYKSLIINNLECIFGNLGEASALTGCTNPRDAAEALGHLASCAVVTCGAQGAWLCQNRHPEPNPLIASIASVKPHRLVDTVGAGDSFVGTFLAKYHSGKSAMEALEAAAEFASQVVALPGATLPSK